uniref:Uncharacterized protein n=1 Tax=Tetranychus urticae TaxID=32264 RepID=T1L2N4_TETUR
MSLKEPTSRFKMLHPEETMRLIMFFFSCFWLILVISFSSVTQNEYEPSTKLIQVVSELYKEAQRVDFISTPSGDEFTLETIRGRYPFGIDCNDSQMLKYLP